MKARLIHNIFKTYYFDKFKRKYTNLTKESSKEYIICSLDKTLRM